MCGVDGLCSALELARRAHVSRRSSDNRANKTRIVMNRLLRRHQLYSHTIAQPPCALRLTLQDSCGAVSILPLAQPTRTSPIHAYFCFWRLPRMLGRLIVLHDTVPSGTWHGSASFICHGQGFSNPSARGSVADKSKGRPQRLQLPAWHVIANRRPHAQPVPPQLHRC